MTGGRGGALALRSLPGRASVSRTSVSGEAVATPCDGDGETMKTSSLPQTLFLGRAFGTTFSDNQQS
eukprot:10934352-Heterocapsa_arctica.AAC.1